MSELDMDVSRLYFLIGWQLMRAFYFISHLN